MDDAPHRAIQPVHRRSSSFFLPMLLLPKPKRRAMQALYYFCRAADDAVDEAANEQDARTRLAFWQREIATIYAGGTPVHPISQQLAEAVRYFSMPVEPFEELLAGLAQDCERPMQLRNWPELERYCYRVAGCVGLQAICIFGCNTPQGVAFARRLGEALQLTNITRDIVEDGQQQRCYIPQDWLAEIGLERATPEEIARSCERLLPLRKKLMKKAEQAFKEADDLAAQLSSRSLLPALLMRDIYQRYLQQMQQGQTPQKPQWRDWMALGGNALKYHFNTVPVVGPHS